MLKATLSNVELKTNSKRRDVRNQLERDPSCPCWDLPTRAACAPARLPGKTQDSVLFSWDVTALTSPFGTVLRSGD